MSDFEFHLRTTVARQFVHLAHRCMDVAVWLAPWLGGRSL
jgi:hypothetical protein